MKITVSFGSDNSVVTTKFSDGATIEDLRRDVGIKATLCYPDGAKFYIHNTDMDGDVLLHEGDNVSIRQGAMEKGV